MRKRYGKCHNCEEKFRARFFDNTKKKWSYRCENKNCKIERFTEGDKREINKKYHPEVLIFIKKIFAKKFMSYEHNPIIIKKRNPTLKGKIDRKMRSYPFAAIHEMAKKEFPEKRIPSPYTIRYYLKKLYGPISWRIPAKKSPYEPRETFT